MAAECRKQAVEVVKRRLDGTNQLEADGFDVTSIHVYETDPEDKLCKSWKHVQEIFLAS